MNEVEVEGVGGLKWGKCPEWGTEQCLGCACRGQVFLSLSDRWHKVIDMINNGIEYGDGYMEPEEEWEREGLLDPAWEKQQKKVGRVLNMLSSLYYRVNAFPIVLLPSLREERDAVSFLGFGFPQDPLFPWQPTPNRSKVPQS
jgi:hypothetical protein